MAVIAVKLQKCRVKSTKAHKDGNACVWDVHVLYITIMRNSIKKLSGIDNCPKQF